MRRRISKYKTVYSPGTGNWFATGKTTTEDDLYQIARKHPYSTYEICEVIRMTNDTGINLHVLGRTLKSITLNEKGEEI